MSRDISTIEKIIKNLKKNEVLCIDINGEYKIIKKTSRPNDGRALGNVFAKPGITGIASGSLVSSPQIHPIKSFAEFGTARKYMMAEAAKKKSLPSTSQELMVSAALLHIENAPAPDMRIETLYHSYKARCSTTGYQLWYEIEKGIKDKMVIKYGVPSVLIMPDGTKKALTLQAGERM